MTRTEERDSIFRIVFREAFFPPEGMGEQTEHYLDALLEEPEVFLPDMKQGLQPKDEDYIRDKVKAIIDQTEELDKMLESASKDWKLSRIGKAELAILRVGAYEIRFDDDIPEKVAINEALELAKKYCDEKAVSFINGVLNQLLTQTE
ncbi:MAG: transcription antitermination factor NusB [Eubacterium sp.]|nr:transcription antitermination factor NusB [Eubacterium sp.]